jgi:hypothetical protein
MVGSSKEMVCPTCNGKGVIPNPKDERMLPWWTIFVGGLYHWLFSKVDEIMCPDCNGTGKIVADQYNNDALKTSVPVLQTKYSIDSEGKPFRLDIEIVENDKKDSILDNTNKQN